MSYRDLLAIRSFKDLWLGQAVSQLGDALYSLVFLFMVDKLTGDPKMVGVAGVAQTLPFLLFSLWAGVVADRSDRRRVMLFSDLSSATILLLFALLVWFQPQPPVWSLIVAGACLSLVNVFFSPAKSAAIPTIVPTEALSAANGLSMATQSLMPVIGLGISGTVLAALYALSPKFFFVSAIVLNALSFIVSALYIFRLPSLKATGYSARTPEVSPLVHAWQDMKDGIMYLRSERVLWVMMVLSILVQFFIAPFMVVYVSVNRVWFGGHYMTLALCEGGFFLGMIAGGAILGRLTVKRPGLAFIWGLATIGLTVAAMTFSHSAWLFAMWNFVAGMGLPLAQIPMMTYVQTVVPDHYRGRVNSVMTMAGMGVQPLAIGIGGLLLAVVGPANMLLGMGSGMALAAFAGFADSSFRNVELATPTKVMEG